MRNSATPGGLLLLLLLVGVVPAQESARERSARPATGEPQPVTSQRIMVLPAEAMRASSPQQTVLLNALQPVSLPPGAGAWAAQVVTRGGVMGLGRGDIVVTSQGDVTLTRREETCAVKLAHERLRRLDRQVAATGPAHWGVASFGSCLDCYQTLLALYRRAEDGGEQMLTYAWDDASIGSLPPEVAAIYAAMMALKEEAEASCAR